MGSSYFVLRIGFAGAGHETQLTNSPAVTRLSRYFLPTTREAPADAEAISHKLVVRAGLARQVGAGLSTFLPAGRGRTRRVEQIVREELDAIGAGEMLMPVLQPARAYVEDERVATTSTRSSS